MKYLAFVFLLGCIMGTSIGNTYKQKCVVNDKDVIEVYRFNVTYVNGVPLVGDPTLTYGESTKGITSISGIEGQRVLQRLYLGTTQTIEIEGQSYWVIPITDIVHKHISGFMLASYKSKHQQRELINISTEIGSHFRQECYEKSN